MPFSLLKLTKLQLLSICFVVVSALTVLGVNRRLQATKTIATDSPSALTNLAPVPVMQKEVPAEKVDVERVSLTERGFAPREINRVKGKFLFVVDARTGSSTPITFGLSEDKGKRLKEAKSNGNQKGWRDFLDLDAGKYLVTVAENPDWICVINVTSK